MSDSKLWWMYVVRCSDDSLYTGITTDVVRRVKEHNGSSKGAKYTRSRRPVSLETSVMFANRSQALKAEYSFKSLSRDKKLAFIKSYCQVCRCAVCDCEKQFGFKPAQ